MKPKQIALLSGKGGAGKTSVTAALIKLFDEVVAVDADVNASNLPILLQPEKLKQSDYYAMDVAAIDATSCTNCGICIATCHFSAIRSGKPGAVPVIHGCEGCASCAFVCPQQAISMVPHQAGVWYQSRMNNGMMLHADLFPGEDNSGKLISKIRNEAAAVAKERRIPYIVIDGPPGTSCQAISSITGVDLVVAVVEESLSGLSDYRRLEGLLEKFRLRHLVVINKAGFSTEINRQIRTSAAEFGSEVFCSLPFDRAIPEALQNLQSLAEIDEYRETIKNLLTELKKYP